MFGLYLHYPFCVKKCLYCDFNSHVDPHADCARYLDALLEECRARGVLRPHTVFLGGGTPSLITAEVLAGFLERLHEVTGFRDSAVEFTIECNPESARAGFLRAARACGATRISLGFQALDEPTLRFFGRVHDAGQARSAFAAAREAGFSDLNVDLIMGAPVQLAEVWEEGLREVVALGPEHLSVYDLMYEPQTALGTRVDRGSLEPVDDRERAIQWLRNIRMLRGAGYRQYEVSAFCRPGHRCRHNLLYWNNREYIGIGAGAASFRSGYRSMNLRDPRRYMGAIESSGRASCSSERLSPGRALAETLMMRLRLEDAIDLSALAARFEVHPDRAFPGWCDALAAARLAIRDGEVFRLTRRGRRLLDGVVASILERAE